VRALLVDDEEALCEALARGLAEEGFVTDVASNGIDGLWLAEENAFDVIILDLMMPGLSGYEVCRRLRAAGSQVPILMLTAKDGEYDEADALDLGADDFLAKPFSFLVLVARLRALLRRAPAERAPLLELGDLRLDPAARRCWRRGAEIPLTPREFALAEYLVRCRGQVLSSAQIAEHVWDAELAVDSSVVKVYIGYLRRKLDAPFGLTTIETVRGVGYRLQEPGPEPSAPGAH
jgi:two-component system OmpR family response regulator